MLIETAIATFLFLCLVFFTMVNLHNILVVHERRSNARVFAEVEHPSGIIVTLAALGTFVYFLEAVIYMVLAFANSFSLLYASIHYIRLPFTLCAQISGLILTFIGYALSIWSVIARGKYATSWGMSENQKLVTWGPYRYVRNPSYLGYFLMFLGFFFLWSSLFTLFPLIAIPGYYHVALEEEKLLRQRFGDKYAEYQKKTGRFIPKLR